MITVVIIANDQRAVRIKEYFQPLVKSQISVDSDYEHGLKSVFDKRPALVFIQGEIDGVSGGAIAKQIKGLLRDSAPRIVLLGDASSLNESARSSYDGCLNFSVPDKELISLFRAELDKQLPTLWREEPAPPPAYADGLQGAKENHAFELVSLTDPVAQPYHAEPLPVTPGPVTETSRAVNPHTTQKKADIKPISSVKDDAHISTPAESRRGGAASTVKSHDIRPTDSSSTVNQSHPDTQPVRRPFSEPSAKVRNIAAFDHTFLESRSTKRKPWLYVAGLSVALALAALIYHFTHPTPPVVQITPPVSSAPEAPAPQAPVTQPATQARIAKLPEIIPLSGKDPGYESHHPGWNRYAGKGMEFKVFNAQGEIKAIQLIATGEQSIPDGMLVTLLGQIFGNASYSPAPPIEKQNYLLESARLPGEAEMVIYRKKTNKEIRGIVVTVP